MSPEAWTFFSVKTTGILALVGGQLAARGKAKERGKKLAKVEQNTLPVSNGAIPRLIEDVAFIRDVVISLDRRVGNLEDQR